MSARLFLPRETTALALGAGDVAECLQRLTRERGEAIELVRNGSRGLCWLEPLLEVETPAGRVAYGPVTPADLPGLLEAGLLEGAATHPLYRGPTESIPYLRAQHRLTFARIGVTDPLSLEDYRAHGGFQGLEAALAMGPAAIIEQVRASGLRGRGGAGFPAGVKWQTVLDTEAADKYIVCNADEGDSGTFADRLLMEGDPYLLIEGMLIAALAVGATQGYIYLRSEYPLAQQVLAGALSRAAAAGYLGDDACGSGQRFDLFLRLGAGAYICGEETALLESLEGRRGQVRARPPLPAVAGLFGQPTVVNNVLTLATVPGILANGAEAYASCGSGRSRGTVAVQLAGNVARGGLVEVDFGTPLRTVLEDFGGGTRSGRPLRAVQVGGPLGAYLPPAQWDTPLDYESLVDVGAMLGHGGVVLFDDTVDMGEQARFAMAFCAAESCGKCTPCRIGAVRGVEVIDRIRAGEQPQENLVLLDDLCTTMIHGSLCGMGGMTPVPVQSVLRHFPADLHAGAQRSDDDAQILRP